MIARQTREIVAETKTLTQRVLTALHIVHWAFDDAGQPYADSISKNKTTLYKVGNTYPVMPKRGKFSAWVNWGRRPEVVPILIHPETKADIEELKGIGYVQLRIKVTAIQIGALHDMTEAQVVCEGVADRAAYIALWNSINGQGAWDANPQVARISFLPVKTFVTDAMLTASPLAMRNEAAKKQRRIS